MGFDELKNKNKDMHGLNRNPGEHVKPGSPAKVGVASPHTAPSAGRDQHTGPKAGGSLGARPNNVQKGAAMPQHSQPAMQRTVSTPPKPENGKPAASVVKPGVNRPQAGHQAAAKNGTAPSSQGYQKTLNWQPQGGAVPGNAEPFTVTFNEKINYMDPEYNLLELVFPGSIVVASNEHRENEATKDLVRTVVKSTLTQKLSQVASSRKTMREIYPEYNNLKDACIKSLALKGFEVKRVNLNGFTLSEKSRAKIDSADNNQSAGRMNSAALQRQLDEASRNAPVYMDNMNPVGYNAAQDPYQAQMYQNQMNGQIYPNQMQAQMGQMYPGQMQGQPYMDNMNPMGYNAAQDPYQAQMMQNQMNGQMYPNQMQGQMGQMYPNQMQGQMGQNMNPMGYNAAQDPYQAQMMQNQMNGQMYPNQMQGQMGNAADAFAAAAAGAMGAFAGAAGAAPSVFCPQCGTQNSGSAFCMNCGAKLC